MPTIRHIDCRLYGDSVHIQIGEQARELSRDDADNLYNHLVESFLESGQEVIMAGMRLTGEEAYRLFDVMELEAGERCPLE